MPHVLREAMQVMLAELELMPIDSPPPDVEQEREAANRGMTLIDSGKWKQRDTTINFPRQWVRQILEMVASGNLSLLDADPPSKT